MIITNLDVPWVVLLCMDSFYKCLGPEDIAKAHRNDYDFDHPGTYSWVGSRVISTYCWRIIIVHRSPILDPSPFLPTLDAFDYDLLLETLHKLKEGKNVDVPIYDFKTHSR